MMKEFLDVAEGKLAPKYVSENLYSQKNLVSKIKLDHRLRSASCLSLVSPKQSVHTSTVKEVDNTFIMA